jgi:hypothetical protein
MKNRPDLTPVGALCAVVLLAAGAPAEAQTTTYLRGRVQLLYQADGQLPVIRVGGANVSVSPTTALNTPTASLTTAQLMDTTPFLGTTNAGFLGARAVVEARPNPTNAAALVANSLYLVPAEDQILGRITATNGGLLSIEGVPVRALTDVRLPAIPTANETGTPVDLAVTQPALGSLASAQGYHDGRVFRAYEIVVSAQTAGDVAPPTLTVASACAKYDGSTAACRVEVSGSVSLRHAAPAVRTQRIAVYRVDGDVEAPLGTLTAVRSRRNFAEARFSGRLDLPESYDPVLRTAPTVLKFVNLDAYPLPVSGTAVVTACD